MRNEYDFYITLADGTTMKFRSTIARMAFIEDNPHLFRERARNWYTEHGSDHAIDDWYYQALQDQGGEA